MPGNPATLKKVIVVGLVTGITFFHYHTGPGNPSLHMIHRELFFVPILLASFWFGLRWGLTTAAAIGIVYAPRFLILPDPHNTGLAVFIQVCIFFLVGGMLGILVDRQKAQQEEILSGERLAALGRASAAIGYEMKNLLGAIRQYLSHRDDFGCTETDRNFDAELRRLERNVDVLSSFGTPEQVTLISRDLNSMVEGVVDRNAEAARDAGVHLSAELDPAGCPSRFDADKIAWVLQNLLTNAIQFTPPGRTVHVRTRRSGRICQVEVADEGEGIRPEHLTRIFSPFFTTRKEGEGLALAGSRKTIRDLGGDILVASEWGKGAAFTVNLPRSDETAGAGCELPG